MEKDSRVLFVSGFEPLGMRDYAPQNMDQPWVTPLRYEPGKEYKMRNGTRRYIADNNGALRRIKSLGEVEG